MTQAALARKMETKQSAIARLESGNSNPTLKFMNKVAKALNTRLNISFADLTKPIQPSRYPKRQPLEKIRPQ